MKISSEMLSVCLATITVLVSCQSIPARDSPTAEFKPLEFPTEIDGALNEGWEHYLMLFDCCIAQNLSHCEVFERAKKDTYIAQLLANTILEQKSIEEVSGLPQTEFDAVVELQTKDNDDCLRAKFNRMGGLISLIMVSTRTQQRSLSFSTPVTSISRSGFWKCWSL